MDIRILVIFLTLAICFSVQSVFAQEIEEPTFVISGGEVMGYTIDPEKKSLIIGIIAQGEGKVIAVLPRSLIDAKAGTEDDVFYVLIGRPGYGGGVLSGYEGWGLPEFDEVKTQTSRTLIIPFYYDVTEIVIVGTEVNKLAPNQQNISWLRAVLPLLNLGQDEQVTYQYYELEMPKHWQKKFDFVLPSAFSYWENRNPENTFGRVDNPEEADFFLQWKSTSDEALGYYACCNEAEQGLITISLGYFEEGEWNFVSDEYTTEVMKHELGHFLGFDHTLDPFDIMYPAFDFYEDWLEHDPEKPTIVDISLPELIKTNAGRWAEGKIGDTDFVSGIQYLIDIGIIQIPASLIPGEISFTENGILKVHGKEFFIAEDEKINVKFSGQYWNWKEKGAFFELFLIDPLTNKDRIPVRTETLQGDFVGWLDFDHFSLTGEYTLKGIIDGDSLGAVKFTIKSGIDPNKIEPEIPVWVKNNAEWWSMDLITNLEFVIGIEYLINEGIIKI